MKRQVLLLLLLLCCCTACIEDFSGFGGLRAGDAEAQGDRQYMQDRITIHCDDDVCCFGVFDGHGLSANVAELASDKLCGNVILALISQQKEGPVDAKVLGDIIRRQFAKTDEEIRRFPVVEGSGSTAVIAVVTPDHIVVGNAGDSRAIIVPKAQSHLNPDGSPTRIDRLVSTVDHKPDSPSEKARIESDGGYISHRGVWRVNGVLATSRSLGDYELRPWVIPTPDIYYFDRSEVLFMVLASDGLWDTISTYNAAGIIYGLLTSWNMTASKAAHDIVSRVTDGSRDFMLDNVACVVVTVDTIEQHYAYEDSRIVQFLNFLATSF